MRQALLLCSLATAALLGAWPAHAQIFGCQPSTAEWACLPRPNGPQPGQIQIKTGLLQDAAWQQAAQLLGQMGAQQGVTYLNQAQQAAQNGDARQSWATLNAIFSTLSEANPQSVAQLAVALNILLSYYLV